ncbi:MAG: low molecular weight phosphatase family protein [Pseudomonadota bacterium]
MGDRPNSVLFACTRNAIRSAMCEGLLKRYLGREIYVDSAGVAPGDNDGFVTAVMQEIDVNLSQHTPKSFDDLQDGSFDLVVTLSPEAQHRAVEMTRTMACDVEYWPTLDPTVVEGSRETRLDAYRSVREALEQRIRKRFGIED